MDTLPIKKNMHFEMTIDDIGVKGEGIGKIDNFTVFVEGALPKDKIEVRIIKVKKNYGFGKLIRIIEASPMRITPKCPYAKRCGGCQIQHLDYKAQLEFKTKKVKDNIERIGKLNDVIVYPTLGMKEPFYYRNKAQFPVGIKDGKVQIGFYAPRSHDIIDISKCYIQDPINNKIINIIRNYIEKYKIPVYDEKKHKGLIRHILTRVGFTTKEIMVCIVINGENLPHKDKLISKLIKISGMTSIVLNHNTKKTNVILGEKITTLWGKNYITDYIGEIKFEISPLSFFQVNPIQTKVLYEKALEYARLIGEEIVWDAYCGIGTISLFLAKKAKKVYGVEIVNEAIEDARKNAKINNIDNVEFFVGKSEEIIPEMYEKQGIKADVIVVDPPRKGCDEILLNTMAKMEPRRIVYVSCDPGTLARDLKILNEKGYKVEKVQPVDMFPNTTHVECVTLMSKVEK
ncbi:23S rRNA (uracil(1939)-C(5))-methyltransferase RlmD [Defluviitalea phaphyphila]|uniref:23S rRNA (uracil(1939)-C(5))-methyltransferase RlmD n=1 Tax=Defluviitalea phaphyphila TaxID=1473580 RepID=UPI000730FCF6|nr:23S rRNA (uracil(1939)-C(5))-methyltransferase RlmD [Defluviitalea phaphyphila]